MVFRKLVFTQSRDRNLKVGPEVGRFLTGMYRIGPFDFSKGLDPNIRILNDPGPELEPSNLYRSKFCMLYSQISKQSQIGKSKIFKLSRKCIAPSLVKSQLLLGYKKLLLSLISLFENLIFLFLMFCSSTYFSIDFSRFSLITFI